MDEDSYFHDDPELIPSQFTRFKRLTYVFALIVLIAASGSYLKTTLAANININAGLQVEFGQGVLATTACDSNIVVKPSSSYSNSAGNFYVSAFTLSNLDTTIDGCVDEALTLNFYNSTSGSSSLGSYSVVYTNGAFVSNSGTISSIGGGTTTSSVTVTLSNQSILAKNVSKFTIESSISTCATGGICQVGDTGPGGGIIFYKAVSAFVCGPTRAATCNYLESAPANWTGNVNGDTGTVVSWSGNTTQAIATTQTAIGWGYKNTLSAVTQDNTPNKVITLARAYTGGGLTDWFVPSKDELNQLYTQKTLVGGFKGSSYWSSSEFSATNVYEQDFSNGNSWNNGKSGADTLRPIRAF